MSKKMPELTRKEMLETLVVFSPKEAAFLLGVTEQHVVNMLNKGEIVGKRLGRRWLIPRCSLDPFFGLKT